MKCFGMFMSAALIATTLTSYGQEDKFANLSSKERISIAQKEEIDSKQDREFQQMMQAGHELFKGKHYLKAIHKYEEAQAKRPYNVYPKVIIADIELSMKDTLATIRKAEEMEKKAEELKPETPKPETKPEEKKEETSTADRIEKMDKWEAEERKKLEAQREREKQQATPPPTKNNGEVAVLSLEDFQKDLAEKYPTGTTESIEKEGNRTTTTRIVVAEGKGNEYKKVVHSWGGVFYFKNGEAVTERVWKETEK